jgi:hypothetical protein
MRSSLKEFKQVVIRVKVVQKWNIPELAQRTLKAGRGGSLKIVSLSAMHDCVSILVRRLDLNGNAFPTVMDYSAPTIQKDR